MASTTEGEAQYSFHEDASSIYPLPNHVSEEQRLRAQHHAVLALLHDQPIQAPLDPPPSVILDVGCGVNADMTIYLARKFPSAKVYGLDLSAVPPRDSLPPNVEFIKGNVTDLVDKDPRLRAGSIDYVFARFLVAGVADADWSPLVRALARLVAPGGWLEMHDTRVVRWFGGGSADRHVISDDWRWLRYLQAPTAVPADDPAGAQYFQELALATGLERVASRVITLPFEPPDAVRDRQPEALPFTEFLAQGHYAHGMIPVFARAFPGEANRTQREELEREFYHTLRPEVGKHTLIALLCGQKPGGRGTAAAATS